jgi:hypothetical protein
MGCLLPKILAKETYINSSSYNGRRDLEIERPILGKSTNRLIVFAGLITGLKSFTLLVRGNNLLAIEAVV